MHRYIHMEKILDSVWGFSLADRNITRSNNWKLELDKFKIEIRCNFLAVG